MSYALRILPSAEKQLAALDAGPYETVKRKIHSLAEDPRPSGCRKLANRNAWRIRVGDYRVIYEINDPIHVVTIVKIDHRREIFR